MSSLVRPDADAQFFLFFLMPNAAHTHTLLYLYPQASPRAGARGTTISLGSAATVSGMFELSAVRRRADGVFVLLPNVP